MTKQEAIKYITNPNNFSYEGLPFSANDYAEFEEIALECIQKCIDEELRTEEESPCSSCQEFDCHGCLYSGKID